LTIHSSSRCREQQYSEINGLGLASLESLLRVSIEDVKSDAAQDRKTYAFRTSMDLSNAAFGEVDSGQGARIESIDSTCSLQDSPTVPIKCGQTHIIVQTWDDAPGSHYKSRRW
jgi:hypothetical protein